MAPTVLPRSTKNFVPTGWRWRWRCLAWQVLLLVGVGWLGPARAASPLEAWSREAGRIRLLAENDPPLAYQEAQRLLRDRQHYLRMSRAHNPFGDGQASLRIMNVLAGEANGARHH